MTESITRKKATVSEEHDSRDERTYKVWIEIEEYDQLTGCGNDCDAPGGALATFDTFDEAYEFAELIDRAYSTRLRSCDSAQDRAATARNAGLQAITTTLPDGVRDAIDAIVSYLWESEHADYEGSPRQDRDKHIVRHLETVARWLTRHTSQPER
jgi:hypothetical protein